MPEAENKARILAPEEKSQRLEEALRYIATMQGGSPGGRAYAAIVVARAALEGRPLPIADTGSTR